MNDFFVNSSSIVEACAENRFRFTKHHPHEARKTILYPTSQTSLLPFAQPCIYLSSSVSYSLSDVSKVMRHATRLPALPLRRKSCSLHF